MISLTTQHPSPRLSLHPSKSAVIERKPSALQHADSFNRVRFGSDSSAKPEASTPSSTVNAAEASAETPKASWGARIKGCFKGCYTGCVNGLLAIPKFFANVFRNIGKGLAKVTGISHIKSFITRMGNGFKQAIGDPWYVKPLKALTWGGATLLVGLIPGLQAMVVASPITVVTTLLVDWVVGFMEGFSKPLPDEKPAA